LSPRSNRLTPREAVRRECRRARHRALPHSDFISIPQRKDTSMNVMLTPVVSLIAGILILIVPRLLNYIVALYLIIIGVIGLLGSGFTFGG
jgi:hypothetical protein